MLWQCCDDVQCSLSTPQCNVTGQVSVHILVEWGTGVTRLLRIHFANVPIAAATPIHPPLAQKHNRSFLGQKYAESLRKLETRHREIIFSLSANCTYAVFSVMH